mmetsp:Transcript_4402/g.12276  ORF Transcript_4402/g.12276 Transcript_4402/m.12276 type:complete len:252 (-) Transcript_4402:183-938(-)
MSLSNRSMPSAPTCALVLRMLSQPLCVHFGKLALNSGSWSSCGHSAIDGVPSFWKILKMVSISESPAKSGARVAISPRMQPTLHMSTGTLYSCEPRRISGARYQTVTTSCVYFGMGTEYALARPKSAIFSRSCRSTRIFCGFKSRWRMRFTWQNSVPRHSWKAMDLITLDSNCLPPRERMCFFKSCGRNSKTSTSFFVEQKTSSNLTTFSWFNSFRSAISRNAVLGMPSSSLSNFIFFMATSRPERTCLAL